MQGTIWTTAPSVAVGQSTTLRWSVQTAGCAVTVQINGVTRTGTSLTVTPDQPTSYSLRVVKAGASRTLGSTALGVTLPTDASGRVVLVVDSNYKQWAFLQAVDRPNALVYVQNHVELDLSGYDSIPIAPGVSIIGGRTAREPGPRLFTTTRPGVLLYLRDDSGGTWGDNVRITGLRIDGGMIGVADSRTRPARSAFGSRLGLNVEIDNNEIYGWQGRRDRRARRQGSGSGLSRTR